MIENYRLMIEIMRELNYAPDEKIILHVLRAVDKYLPKYFPNGEFTKCDITAIIMIESSFDPYARGTSGEFGLMQVMYYTKVLKHVKTTNDIVEDNIQAGLYVLKQKYDKHQDYRTSLIAYNGLISTSDGYKDDYYKKFLNKRIKLDNIRCQIWNVKNT